MRSVYGIHCRGVRFSPIFSAQRCKIADVRHDLGDDFAIGPQHEPQHAMRARMLRPHVDEHLVRADVELDDAGVFNCGMTCQLSVVRGPLVRGMCSAG